MKRILFILIAALTFTACSSDDPDDGGGTGGGGTTTFDNWNDPKSPNYKPNGYNPLLGEWARSDNMIKIIFTNDFRYQRSYWENGKWLSAELLSTYKINDKVFKTDKKVPYDYDKIDTFPYQLGTDQEGEYLIITYPLGDVKYYRLSE